MTQMTEPSIKEEDIPKIMSLQLNLFQKELLYRFVATNDTIISSRCGWGSGKSLGLLACLLCRSEVVGSNEKSLIVTDTYSRMQSVIMPLFNEWLAPIGWTFSHTGSYFQSPNGHQCMIKSWFNTTTTSSTHSNPLEGINASCAFIDECQVFSPVIYNKVVGRVRAGSQPKIVMVGLPTYDAWWCKIAQDNGYKPLYYSSYVNKANLSQAWFDNLKSLPVAERQAMIDNNPLPPSGGIYQAFNPYKHVIEHTYNPDELTYLTMDFGFRSPVIQIYTRASSLDNALVLMWEFVGNETKLSSLIDTLKKVCVPRSQYNPIIHKGKFVIDKATGDKAGHSRSDRTGHSTFKEIQEATGLRFETIADPIRVNVLNGISRVTKLIEDDLLYCEQDVWNKGLDEPKSFRNAIQGYKWKEGSSKEEPVKDDIHDHSMDALRYLVINFFWRGLTPIDAPKPKLGLFTNTAVVGVASNQTQGLVVGMPSFKKNMAF